FAFKGIPATPPFYQVLYCHNEGAPLRMIRYEGTTEEKDALKEKIRRLKAKKETLVNEVEEMRMAITETMFELKENIKEKRMMLTMIFLLGIFYSYSVHDVILLYSSWWR
ncbi:Ribosomal protein S12 methylthiotransferase RimO, partial [Bienertia sinuspersici]